MTDKAIEDVVGQPVAYRYGHVDDNDWILTKDKPAQAVERIVEPLYPASALTALSARLAEIEIDRSHFEVYADEQRRRAEAAEARAAALERERDDFRSSLATTIGKLMFAQDRIAVLERELANQPSSIADPIERFIADVRIELQRAREKFPGDRVMIIALAEEFGELAKAMLDEPQEAVWKEAVQTAVVAARVAIDGDSSVDEWRAAKGLDNHRVREAE